MDQFVRTLTDNWGLFLDAFANTIKLTVISGIASLLLGTLLAAMRVSPVPAFRIFSGAYTGLLINTPLVLVFFFVAFGFPYLQINFSFFLFAAVSLTAYTAAFVCEAVRSGINTVAAGQAEAARSLGLTFGQTLTVVILPQAVRAVVPPLASIMNALLKNTTVAAGFSVAEAGAIRSNLSELGYPVLDGLIWVVIGFLILVIPLTITQRRLEQRWSVFAMTTNMLYDVPGPKARTRNRLIGVVGTVVIVAGLGYVVFRFNDTGQFSAKKWSIFEYENVQRTILDGYLHTLYAAGVAAVLALTLGGLLAAARISPRPPVRTTAFGVVELFRAIPLILLMFLFYYGAPQLGFRVSPFWAVVLGLTLYNGAFFAELFRAGIEAVPKGQREAAAAIGLRRGQVMRSVLLPQATRSMLPAIVSQLVVLLKDTALGFLVTYDELLKQLKQLATAGEFEFPLIPLVVVGGAMYIATCLLLAWVARLLERRLNRSARTTGPVGRGAVDDPAGAGMPLAATATGE